MDEYTLVESEEQVEQFRGLVIQYAVEMGFDLQQQKLKKELAELPGDYAPPGGLLLLALSEEQVVGCAALRQLDQDDGEVRRLYVVPGFRGKRIAKGLMMRTIEEARGIGYQRLKLVTLPSMRTAISLYRGLGFDFIPPYRATTDPSARFMELRLVD